MFEQQVFALSEQLQRPGGLRFWEQVLRVPVFQVCADSLSLFHQPTYNPRAQFLMPNEKVGFLSSRHFEGVERAITYSPTAFYAEISNKFGTQLTTGPKVSPLQAVKFLCSQIYTDSDLPLLSSTNFLIEHSQLFREEWAKDSDIMSVF
jgi:hypothetical protein